MTTSGAAGAAQSFYWFDYETFGRSARFDRPAQFAGRRTDLQLNPIGEADDFHCRLSDDYLPEPAACRITGISPDRVQADGLREADFIARVLERIGAPGTCSAGYNSIRFDDEFTRHTLFRNLHDPYAQEWRDGASRWDLFDVARLTRALRPDGIEWPLDEEGQPRNSLEALAAANGIGHDHAHDALSDVDATIGLARLIRLRQPRLFDWLFAHRGKAAAATLLNTRERAPLLLASSRIPRERQHLGIVMALCRHPERAGEVIVADLAQHPDRWLDLDDATLRERLFARRGDPGADASDIERPGLFTLKLNACPVLAPFVTLRPADAERLGRSRSAALAHRDRWLERLDGATLQRLGALMVREWPIDEEDVDGSLYVGGFLSDADRRRLTAVRAALSADMPADRSTDPSGEPGAPPTTRLDFDDDRLCEQVFRYRARNWPERLNADERARWEAFRRDRLTRERAPWMTFARFDEAMREQPWTPCEATLRRSLEGWRSALERPSD